MVVIRSLHSKAVEQFPLKLCQIPVRGMILVLMRIDALADCRGGVLVLVSASFVFLMLLSEQGGANLCVDKILHNKIISAHFSACNSLHTTK